MPYVPIIQLSILASEEKNNNIALYHLQEKGIRLWAQEDYLAESYLILFKKALNWSAIFHKQILKKF